MHRILSLLVLVGTAQAAQVTIPLRLTVQPVCELSRSDATTLTLRCTRDYRPADPRALPELTGRLPLGEWQLTTSDADPRGGTLNTYALVPGSPTAITTFY